MARSEQTVREVAHLDHRKNVMRPQRDRGLRVVNLWPVHPRADWPSRHLIRRIWPDKAGRIMRDIEPLLVVRLREDQRHPVVERGNVFVGFRRENGGGPHPLTARRVLPVLPQPGKREELSFPQGDGERLLGMPRR